MVKQLKSKKRDSIQLGVASLGLLQLALIQAGNIVFLFFPPMQNIHLQAKS